MNDMVPFIRSSYFFINSSLKANNNQIYMDYHDGKYGINTDPNRGADTFLPFNDIKLTGAKYKIYTTSSDNARNITVDVLKDGYVQFCCTPITNGCSLTYNGHYACLYVNQVIQENILTNTDMCCSDIVEVKSGNVLKLFMPAYYNSKGQTKGYLLYTEGVI